MRIIWRLSRRLAGLLRRLRCLALANFLLDGMIWISLAMGRPNSFPVSSMPSRKFHDEGPKRTALKACLDVLESLNLEPFLAYGTLLGAVRSKTFLSSDNDVDLGLFWKSDSSLSVLSDAFENSRFQVLISAVQQYDERYKLLHPNGVTLDLVLFTQCPDGRLVNRVMLYGYSLEKYRSGFSLSDYSFLGLSVKVPDPPESFLIEQYGDWDDVALFYHPFLSPPVQTHLDSPFLQYLAKSAFLEAFYLKRDDTLLSCMQMIISKDRSSFWNHVNQKLGVMMCQ